MTSLLLLCAGLVGAAAGRFIMGRWFNHLTLYSAIWGIVLALTTLGLVHYYELVSAAWQHILLAWVQLFVGSLTAAALINARSEPPTAAPAPAMRPEVIRVAILALCGIAMLGIAVELIDVFRSGAGFQAALLGHMGDRYQARIRGENAGIPYVGSLALTASALAGTYTARTRRFGPVSLLPLSLVVFDAIAMAGRTGIGIAGALFATTFLLTPREARVPAEAGARPRRLGALIAFAVAIAVAIAGFTLISATRGLVVDLPGIDPAMASISRQVPFMPSLYAHVSIGPATFSEYLKAGAPRVFPGTNTFAPFLRALNRLGIGPGVAYYEEVYYTPIEANVGTWLKNLYADFGPTVTAWFPFVIGALMTWLTVRARRTGSMTSILVLGQFMAVIMLSFTYNIMVAGDWWVSMVAAVIAGLWLDRQARPAAQ